MFGFITCDKTDFNVYLLALSRVIKPISTKGVFERVERKSASLFSLRSLNGNRLAVYLTTIFLLPTILMPFCILLRR